MERQSGAVDASPDDRAAIVLLGPFEIRFNGTSTNLGGGGAAALVAVLALQIDEPIGRAELVDVLWPREQPRDDHAALRQLVLRARRELPSGAIERSTAGGQTTYRLLSDRVDVDLHRLMADGTVLLGSGTMDSSGAAERLRRVSGPPLSGLPDLKAFDEMRHLVERQLEELTRHALISWARSGDSSVLPDIAAWLADRPDDEGVWTAEIDLLTRSGRAAAAARRARIARRELAAFGFDPGASLCSAELRALEISSMSEFVPRLPRSSPSVIGRSAELAAATDRISGGRETDGPILITVCGPPGVGVSEFVRALANVMSGTRQIAYVEIESASGGRLDSGDGDELLAELASSLGWSSMDGDARSWIRTVIPGGTVLLLDFDGSAVELSDLVARLDVWPGSIVLATRRPIGAAHEWVLRLAPLSPQAAVEMILQRVRAVRGRPLSAGEATDIERFCNSGDHLPLVLNLLARQMATRSAGDVLAAVPNDSSVAERVGVIVEEVEPIARTLMHRLCWIDGPFDVIDVVRLLPPSAHAANSGADPLALVVSSGLVEFDPLQPEAPYRILPVIAAALRARPDSVVARIDASHRRAVTLAARGRLWAAAIGGPDEPVALRHLTPRIPELLSALQSDLPKTPAVRRSILRAVTHILVTTGRTDEANRLVKQHSSDQRTFTAIAQQAVVVSYYLDDFNAVLESSERIEPTMIDPCDLFQIRSMAVRSLRNLGRYVDAHVALDRLAEATDPANGVDHAQLRMERGMLLAYEDEALEGTRLLAEAAIEFRDADLPRAVGACDLHNSWCSMAVGHHERASELLGRATEVAKMLGHTADEFYCRATAARFAVQTGEYEQALRESDEIVQWFRYAKDQLSTARLLEVRAAALSGLHRPSDDAVFEASMIRRRIHTPLAPFETRWMGLEPLTSIA